MFFHQNQDQIFLKIISGNKKTRNSAIEISVKIRQTFLIS